MVEVIIYWVLWALAACFNIAVIWAIIRLIFAPDCVDYVVDYVSKSNIPEYMRIIRKEDDKL